MHHLSTLAGLQAWLIHEGLELSKSHATSEGAFRDSSLWEAIDVAGLLFAAIDQLSTPQLRRYELLILDLIPEHRELQRARGRVDRNGNVRGFYDLLIVNIAREVDRRNALVDDHQASDDNP